MHLLLLLLLKLIVLALAAFESHGQEDAAPPAPPYSSKVAQITKHIDTNISLYSVNLLMRYQYGFDIYRNLLIDIDAPLIWYDCSVQWDSYPEFCGSFGSNKICSSPVSCQESQCADVRTSYSYQSPQCPPVTNSSSFCNCPVNVVNPITGSCGQPLLSYDQLFMNTSDGRNTVQWFLVQDFNGACASSSALLNYFPADVSGILALSTSPYALPSFLYPYIKILALCLPSSSFNPGILFVGSGPYYLNPQSDVDITSLLSYTPLLKQSNSFGYFIGVGAILINGKPIPISVKDRTARLSTITPYTTLRTDIYDRFISSFSNATKQIPRVGPIQPFGLCFNTSSVGHTRVGLRVPHVAFYLQNRVKWTIFGANSMKQISEDVACLAFVDGGMKTEEAIVIGTQQMEDNLLVFNLHNSTLGFSSSLLYRNTSCANFDYTMV